MLIKLKDGGVNDIWEDADHYSGCPTCDYGSQYINEIKITLTRSVIKATLNQMYKYKLSEGYLMRVFLSNADRFPEMTEKEFTDWFKHIIYDLESTGEWYDGLKIDFTVTPVKPSKANKSIV